MPEKKIRVMISSRCNDVFDGAPLSDLRKRAKERIEAAKLFGSAAFEVWINEDAPPDDTSQDSLDVCLDQVDAADLVVVLSNGNAGWAPNGADIGICHAELMRGVNASAGKVRLISLGSVAASTSDPAQTSRDKRFQKFLENQNFFRGGTVRKSEQAIERIEEAILDGVHTLLKLGVREARKGRYHTGEALQWSNLNFRDRQARMVDTLASAFAERGGVDRDGNRVVMEVGGHRLLFVIHAIPAALTIASAREMVGQPFLRDFELADIVGDVGGPIHVIGCQKTTTETQATAMLGFPDATVVAAPFGIYAADPIQNVQFLFLQNCRDQTMTRFSAQRFFDWLAQSSEDIALARRGVSRAKIVSVIADEYRSAKLGN